MEWLEHSYQLCITIKNNATESYNIEDFDKFETLTSRFARTADILIQKIYRSIDLFEMESTGTLIDSTNDIRNNIAHEYIQEQLFELFKEVVDLTPLLMKYVDTARHYCVKMID